MIIEKSLEEVWTWKEAVYNDIKDMTVEEQLRYFEEKSNSFLHLQGYKKKILSSKIYQLEKVN
ncbi:MAG: hypothetical protein JXJ04_23945 [Spirochaetales bacterium]|nr:hypothetical protein [Spirochaetales bacterium]